MAERNLAEKQAGTKRFSLNKRTATYLTLFLIVAAVVIVYFVSSRYRRHEDKKPLPTQTMTKPEQKPVY